MRTAAWLSLASNIVEEGASEWLGHVVEQSASNFGLGVLSFRGLLHATFTSVCISVLSLSTWLLYTMQNNSALAEAETQFAQALQLFPRQDDSVTDESPVLDPSAGLAACFRKVCSDRLEELGESQLDFNDTMTLWQLEHNTWDLVADLYL